MPLPIAQLMGLASSAVECIQMVFTKDTPKGNFETELNTALEGKTKAGKASIMDKISKKGITDDESLNALLADPQGIKLIQFMSALKGMGINTADIKALLTGSGTDVSDDALKSILKYFGVNENEITKLIADADLKGQVKASLADSIMTSLKSGPAGEGKDGIDLNGLIDLSTKDNETFDALLLKINSPDDTMLKDPNAQAKFLAASGIASASEEIKTMLGGALKKTDGRLDINLQKVAGNDIDALINAESGLSADTINVDQTIDFLENTVNIPKEVLKDLFFATEDDVRKKAVNEVTSKISEYLNANNTKTLKQDFLSAVSLLKKAMGQGEFSGIEKTLKQKNLDIALFEGKGVLNKDMFITLVKRLNENPSAASDKYVKDVMDQIRNAIPAHIKNGEGSMTLKLHPPILGRVDVSMNMQDGQLQAVFRTEQVLTRDILQQNINLLKEGLAEQGIKATTVTITAGIEGKSFGDGYLFADQFKHHHGSSHNGKRPDPPGRNGKDDGEFVYGDTGEQGVSVSGRLDVIA